MSRRNGAFVPALLALVVTVLLSACGGGETTDRGGAGESAAAPATGRADTATVPTPPAIPVIATACPISNPAVGVAVDVVGWDEPVAAAFVDAVTACGAGNYRVQAHRFDEDEALAVMAVDAATGAPEIELYQGPVEFLMELARAGRLQPIDGLVEAHGQEYGLDAIDGPSWAAVSHRGQRFAVPVLPTTRRSTDAIRSDSVSTVEHGFAIPAGVDADHDALFLAAVAGWSAEDPPSTRP